MSSTFSVTNHALFHLSAPSTVHDYYTPVYSPEEMLRLCYRSTVLPEMCSIVGEQCFSKLMDVFAGVTVTFPSKAPRKNAPKPGVPGPVGWRKTDGLPRELALGQSRGSTCRRRFPGVPHGNVFVRLRGNLSATLRRAVSALPFKPAA